MPRWTFHITSALSLLLLLAVVGLWVDSYSYTSLVNLRTESGDLYRLTNSSGISGGVHRLGTFGRGSSRVRSSVGWFANRFHDAGIFNPDEYTSYFLGFAVIWETSPMSNRDPLYIVMLPHWFLTLIFAILPTFWIFKWNKRRKLNPNACPACGYDLTGNETGECSECGRMKSNSL